MKKALLMVFIWLTSLGAASAQWMPDVPTLSYKTGLHLDSCSTRALNAIRIIPNEMYHNEFLIFVPERLDRQYLRKEFFHLAQGQVYKPLLERLNENVYRVSKTALPIGDYAVRFQYKNRVATYRLKILQ